MPSENKPADATMTREPARYAFRCKNCGHLHHAEHAGDNEVPHSCVACGAGVSFGPDRKSMEKLIAEQTGGKPADLVDALQMILKNPAKNYHPDNWEILAETPEPQLKSYGLSQKDVAKHTAKHRGVPPEGKHVQVSAEEGVGTKNSPS